MTSYPNWFAGAAQANFEQFLLPKAGKFGLTYLQLGVYTGDASVWLCENVLTGDQSRLFDVDTWAGSDEPAHKTINFDDVFDYYQSRVKGKQVQPVRATTVKYLTDMADSFHYDFIYIDADHTSAGVLLDAELSWPLLKSGGIMAFDDYEWLHADGVEIHAPKLGIHMFLDRHDGEFDTLVVNQQYWIRKR